MLKIQKDESVYGYIYRTHVVNGISDFSNLITTQGCWKSFPRVLDGTLHYYQEIDDSTWLKFLRDIQLALKPQLLFGDPGAYRAELESFLGVYNGRRKFSQGSSQIKYCLDCIKSDIRRLGFGIFNIKWIEDGYCYTHEKELRISKAENRKKAINTLHNIYRGIDDDNYYTPGNTDSTYDYYYEKVSVEGRSNFIAPCLVEDLKEFIRMNTANLSRDLDFGKHLPACYLNRTYMMEKIFETARRIRYRPFEEFWSSFAETKSTNTGVVDRKSITEKTFKSSRVDCQDCKYYRCSFNMDASQ